MQPTAMEQAYPFFRDPWKGLKYNVSFPQTRAGRVSDLLYLPVDLFYIAESAWECTAVYVLSPILGYLAWIIFWFASSVLSPILGYLAWILLWFASSIVLVLGALPVTCLAAVLLTARVVIECM